MDKLKELEQLKSEYKEIPVPEDGISGVQAAMERAVRKKTLKKRVIRYMAMVAAAAFVVLIVPKDMFFMGGAANESANVKVEDKDGNLYVDLATKNANNEMVDTENGVDLEQSIDAFATGQASKIPSVAPEAALESAEVIKDQQFDEELLKKEEIRVNISEEIRSQIRLAQEAGKECFVADTLLSQSFTCIAEEQEYYINSSGLLVIVFEPGEVAPYGYGKIEFVIPDEVWK